MWWKRELLCFLPVTFVSSDPLYSAGDHFQEALYYGVNSTWISLVVAKGGANFNTKCLQKFNT